MKKENFKSWKEFALSDVCNVFSGTSAPQAKEYFSPTGKPFIRVSDLAVFGRTNNLISCRDRVSERAVKEKRLILARRGTVLFPKSGAAILNNNRALLGIDAYIVNHLAAITPRKAIDSRFLFYLFCGIDMRQYIPNPSYPSLNLSALKQMKVFLPTIDGQPDIAEQKRIADKLDKLFAEIDKAIKNTQAALEYAEKILQSELQKIFGGEISANWGYERIGKVCDVFSGTSAPQDRAYFSAEGKPFIRVSDLAVYGRTSNLVSCRDYVNEQAIKEKRLVLAQKGTVLFPKSGAAILNNNRALLGVDAYIVNHLAAITPMGNIDSRFLFYFLCNIDMAQYIPNPSYPSLRLSEIKQIKLFLPVKNGQPDIAEQKRIADRLDKLYMQVEQLKVKYKEQLDCWFKLKQSLLNKAFQGEL